MRTRTAAVLVAVVAIAMYAGALSSGFVGDDFMILHRLRDAGGLAGVPRFFRGEFFEYYRPLGFVFHALDWSLAGASARQFHLTNILLHAINAMLVVFIGREMAPRSLAGPLAGLLFAVHASNHEAVVWISARFDLLATGFSLAALWVLTRRHGKADPLSALLFLGALLSKESAVAMPIAAAAFMVFPLHSGSVRAATRVAPWIAALAAYSVLRHLAGGVSAIGGATRIPKLAAFLVLLALVLLAGNGRWLKLRIWLRDHRTIAIGSLAVFLGIGAALAAAGGRIGQLVADKLAVAGFALFHLATPVLDMFESPFYLEPGTTMYWLGGVLAIGLALVVLALAWRPLVDDDRAWFLGAFLAAALLPISALTEGARYLYLPSAAFCLLTGVLIGELRGRSRTIAGAMLGLFLAVSAVQIVVKVRDWQWAGRMTADGARLVDASLAPWCGSGHVVFLTEPVAIRSVYTHFLYETLEMPRGCMPGDFQILARMLRVDSALDARWEGPRKIVVIAPAYRGNISLSSDLRNFDPPIRGAAPVAVDTPLGGVLAERIGDAERLTLTLASSIDPARIQWFYYSNGGMRALAK